MSIPTTVGDIDKIRVQIELNAKAGTWLEGDYRIKPGSPEEVLKHYGVKGMKWGVRNEDDESAGPSAAKETPKVKSGGGVPIGSPAHRRMVETVVGGPHIPPNMQGGQIGQQKKQPRLSKEQKIALAFGAAGAAAAGYYAYSSYKSGAHKRDLTQIAADFERLKNKPDFYDVAGLKNGPLSKNKLGDLAHGLPEIALKNPNDLVLNTSRGYADFIHKDGFTSKFAADRHADLISTFEEMRNTYPSVRNLNVEFVPMTSVPGMEGLTEGAFAAVMPIRKGEARIIYNDVMDTWGDNPAQVAAMKKFIPGLRKDKYVGYHEMGHVLAVANGQMPPADRMLSGAASLREQAAYSKNSEAYHRALFQKHGLSFKELSKLGGYAASEPAEALAELAGYYHQPEMRRLLTPEQLKKAKALFDDIGGVS